MKGKTITELERREIDDLSIDLDKVDKSMKDKIFYMLMGACLLRDDGKEGRKDEDYRERCWYSFRY